MMILRNIVSLVGAGFTWRRTSTLAPLFSVAMAAGASLILMTLLFGLRRIAVGGVLSSLPITRLVVGPKQFDVLFFRIGSTAGSLNESLIDTLEDIPGVETILPEMILTMPTSLMGNLIGTSFSSDCATYGVPEEFFPENERPDEFKPLSPGEAVPVILSSQLVELYNTGFADAQNLPGLSSKALIGRHFQLFIGTSSFFPAPPGTKIKTVRCRIVGVSDLVSVTGVTVPESYVRQWHDWYYEGEKEPKYASFHLILQSSDVVSDVRKSVETLGLQSRNSGEIADKVALLTRYLSLATGILMMVFLLLAGLGTAQTLGLEVTYHSQKIGLYRALGASRRDITRVYILRALTIGIVGAFCGTLPAVVLLSSAETWMARIFPFIGRLPSSPFHVSPAILAIALILSTGASLVAGFGPARRASRVEPVMAFRQRET